jgi:hypothetical protein
MMKHQPAPIPSARRDARTRIQMSVNRFAAWQRRRTPAPTPILTRLIRLLAR